MARRHYGQACSVAGALDRIGERWSLLIVRELLLGPLRFRDLTRAVGGAPTDVLTKRLRDLEADGVVARRELQGPVPPARRRHAGRLAGIAIAARGVVAVIGYRSGPPPQNALRIAVLPFDT